MQGFVTDFLGDLDVRFGDREINAPDGCLRVTDRVLVDVKNLVHPGRGIVEHRLESRGQEVATRSRVHVRRCTRIDRIIQQARGDVGLEPFILFLDALGRCVLVKSPVNRAIIRRGWRCQSNAFDPGHIRDCGMICHVTGQARIR